MRLSQLHRDDQVLVVHKPSGLLTHRGWGRDRDTALARARDMVGQRVYLPHRLDRATSGVLLMALDLDTQRVLSAAFEAQRVHKRYLALVRGHAPDAGVIDHPIVVPGRAEGLAAVSDFVRVACSPLERCSLLCLSPRSGRPHQLRRHLKHISHPIVGDTRYGKGDVNRYYRAHYGLVRLALHAFELSFEHPRSGVPLVVRAPVPADLREAWAALGLPVELPPRLESAQLQPQPPPLAPTAPLVPSR